jgi:hypothetical protein
VKLSGDLDYTSYIKEFTIQLVNPYASATVPTFEVFYYSSGGTLLAEITSGLTYTTTGGSCTMTSAIRYNTEPETYAIYSMTFECADKIPTAGYVYIYIPIY